jgi:hypothetical protein
VAQLSRMLTSIKQIAAAFNVWAVAAILGLTGLTYTGSATERLWMDVKINGKEARLIFDSGADDLILWRASAQRLGLAFTEPDTNAVLSAGEVNGGMTEACNVSLFGKEVKTRFRVTALGFDFADSFDGIVGWRNLRNNILQIDAAEERLVFLHKVPKKARGWTQLCVVTNAGILELKVSSENLATNVFLIDTGSQFGLALPPEKWKDWKREHSTQPTTLNSFFSVDGMQYVSEEAWADRFLLGPLCLTGVPIKEATQMETALGGGEYGGSLGFAVLKRLDLIIDGRRGVAYLRPKKTPATPYQHNRAGVVFLPDQLRHDDLVARVAEGSPAYEAGIRNGDALLQIDGMDITKLQDDGLERLEMPAGTKITLKLRRDGNIFAAAITLKEILSSANLKLTRH